MSKLIFTTGQYRLPQATLVRAHALLVRRKLFPRGGALSVVAVGTREMQRLNAQWHHTNRPTDVLAFPLGSDHMGDRSKYQRGSTARVPAVMAGEIFICPPYARAQAKAHGHPYHRELLLLVIHGMLHIAGWDHDTHVRKREMFALQETLLNVIWPSAHALKLDERY